MQFLIVDSYYRAYLQNFYARHPDYAELGYRDAWKMFMDEGTDVGDSYSKNLRKLGHEAEEVILNDEILQKGWAAGNGMRKYGDVGELSRITASFKRSGRQFLNSSGPVGRKLVDWLRRPLRRLADPWVYEILAAQITRLRPDVLLNHALGELDEGFLRHVRPFVRLIVGEHASPLSKNIPYSSYDLILSSLPHYVDSFRRRGAKSEYFRLAFNSSVLDRVSHTRDAAQVVHVGSYRVVHDERNQLLEQVAKVVRVDFWGFGIDNLSKDSPILATYHGEAWGLQRDNIFYNSRIVLTKHITSVAGQYANNQTLYEATGLGALLITDMKDNLNDLFEVGKEIVAYRDAQECVELVKYYLEHEDERATIAQAGHERTMREHTRYHRMEELIGLLERYLP